MHKRVLEIVTFAISIGTEFIENEAENVKKNDCGTKMLKRFAERLKKEYLRFTRVLKKACCIWALYELSFGLFLLALLTFIFSFCK